MEKDFKESLEREEEETLKMKPLKMELLKKRSTHNPDIE